MTLLRKLLPFLLLLNLFACAIVEIENTESAMPPLKNAKTETSIHGFHFDAIDPTIVDHTLLTIEEIEDIMNEAINSWNLMFPSVAKPEMKTPKVKKSIKKRKANMK